MELPDSIAIAGIYGYIGQRIYQAASELGIKVIGYDTADRPDRFQDNGNLAMYLDENDFYNEKAALWHIALHPEHRDNQRLAALLKRNQRVTIEKPMAHPENPEDCFKIINMVKHSDASVLFDFIELFSPLTSWFAENLSEASKLEYMLLQTSKDREADTERNKKKIVPIQYQESVHSLAFMLYTLAKMRSPNLNFKQLFPKGIRINGTSKPYCPPNPDDYEYTVDGKVDAVITINDITVDLSTDFKAGSIEQKRRHVQIAGNDPHHFDLEYQHKKQYARMDSSLVSLDQDLGSYRNAIISSWYMHNHHVDITPNARFAMLCHGLSSALWEATHLRKTVHIGTEEGLKRTMNIFPSYLIGQKQRALM